MDTDYWKRSPFGEESIFHPNFDNKDLKIRYVFCQKDDKYTYLYFDIVARNLSSEKATLIVVECEVFRDETIVSQSIDISRNGTKRFRVKFNETILSKSFLEGEFEFKATVSCDGISATTGEFRVKYGQKQTEKNENFKQNDFSFFQVCPIDKDHRSHFVLHCTAGNMTIKAIKTLTKYDDVENRARSKAHAYVLKDGTILQIWPFKEKRVWATKAESLKNLKGQMFHIEINYDSKESPTEEQYQSLVNLYLEASAVEGCWPPILSGNPHSHD